jgi:hypothetical protein
MASERIGCPYSQQQRPHSSMDEVLSERREEVWLQIVAQPLAAHRLDNLAHSVAIDAIVPALVRNTRRDVIDPRMMGGCGFWAGFGNERTGGKS